MKKTGLLLIVMLLALLLCLFGAGALAEDASAGDMDEWTVMFYICGSDLESKYSFATGYLADIGMTMYPNSWMTMVAEYYGLDPESMQVTVPGKVNVLIETGGSEAWHTRDEGVYLSDIPVDPDALQRWSYDIYPDDVDIKSGYTLLESLPVQSMAAPETLADFIRWGVETRPAKKYALVLWDHGGGALTGMFIDELFDNDVMYLYELRQALADGGVMFDTLIIDACLMSNVETAWNVRESARWMVASEEEVPGKGTAVQDWLQALYAYPECNGEWLGRCVCDMTGIMYANGANQMAKSLLTWSVIDLSRIDRLVEACDAYFRIMGDALVRYPSEVMSYTGYIFDAEAYGEGQQNMHDLGAVIYNQSTMHNVSLRVRGELMDALAEAVAYTVRGPGRNAARGLSFCYPAACDSEALDIYAQNCPMPTYLAYIDAISPWTAPDWVYETVVRLPEIDTIEELAIVPAKVMTSDGMPALTFGETERNVKNVCYNLYRLDELTGQTMRLGHTLCGFVFEESGPFNLLWRATDPLHWPAVDGELCCIDMIQDSSSVRLYNIPVQINSQNCILRCGRTINYEYSEEGTENRYSDYEVYGVWENYDENSMQSNRSVQPLAMYSGQECRLLYPLDSDGGRQTYAYGEDKTIRRTLDVDEIPLPAGTYYLEYEVQDSFMRCMPVDRIEFYWDGENMTFPEGFAWEGSVNE